MTNCPKCGRKLRQGKGHKYCPRRHVLTSQTKAVEDWYQWQGAVGVVEPFKSVLGSDYFNHGGLLRVTTAEGIVELSKGDWLVVSKVDGSRRVVRAKSPQEAP